MGEILIAIETLVPEITILLRTVSGGGLTLTRLTTHSMFFPGVG
jgi:hypothetical protein